jgi:hypothetical protein
VLFLPRCQGGRDWIQGDIIILTHKSTSLSTCQPLMIHIIKVDNSPFIPFHLFQKFCLSFNHIQVLMAIMVYPFLYVFADITQFLQPAYGSFFSVISNAGRMT